MCLKVNRDTFFLPDPSKGVYLRNNLTSLRMEGGTIDKWIEKLIPVFDGTRTLEYITNDLPESFQNRVYEIAQILYQNGFVRDVSQDLPNKLPKTIINKYASQIEYLDSISGSGGYRFQTYRQAKVIVVASGPLLLSFIISLLKSGLPNLSIVITDYPQTNLQRIKEILSEVRKSEPEIEINIINPNNNSWIEILEPYDSVLYGLKDGDLEQLRLIQAICKERNKFFFPVTILNDLAFAGPLVDIELEGCWESAFRRIHLSPSEKNNSFSPTAGALLANLAVFELFKKITGIRNVNKDKIFYLLNLETLEGNWHTFLPHPLVTGQVYAKPIKDYQSLLENRKNEKHDLHSLFIRLTSKESGIFNIWEEEDLRQLPLSQCRIQVADPLSAGPAQLYTKFVCSGLTHEEARLEAGLFGIETYIRGFADGHILKKQLNTFTSIGIGTGETTVEGLFRALNNWLSEEFLKQEDSQVVLVSKLEVRKMGDKRCRFFFQALTTLGSELEIYQGKGFTGFPVVWIGSNGHWYGSTGLNLTMAMSKALQLTLMNAQNKESFRTPYGIVASSVKIQNKSFNISVPSFEDRTLKDIILSALLILKQNKKKVFIFDLNLEPIFKERTAGIYGLLVREEEL